MVLVLAGCQCNPKLILKDEGLKIPGNKSMGFGDKNAYFILHLLQFVPDLHADYSTSGVC